MHSDKSGESEGDDVTMTLFAFLVDLRFASSIISFQEIHAYRNNPTH